MLLSAILVAAAAVAPAFAASNISVPTLNVRDFRPAWCCNHYCSQVVEWLQPPMPTRTAFTANSIQVPACPKKGTVTYAKSVPDKVAFPLTKVEVCYDDSHIDITFTAFNETDFFVNSSYGTNDPIYQYTAMETFISRGTGDPQTYLEFEVAPNNVTFQAFIYNPSKVRADGAPFDTFYVATPLIDGLTATTTLDKPKGLWVSSARIPLGFFNVDDGTAKGTVWRMNFFRIITHPATFPAQFYGAWNQPDEANFHMSPYFGHVNFV